LSNSETFEPLEPDRLGRLSRAFKALSNPNRLELFVQILRTHDAGYEAGHECFIAEVMRRLEIGAPTVSHHLKELANAGLVSTERRGRFVVARPGSALLDELRTLLAREIDTKP